MKITYLYDYSPLKDDEAILLKNIQNKIDPETVLIIGEKEASVNDKKVTLTRDLGSGYYTQQYVGLISLKEEGEEDQNILIDSRFCKMENGQKNYHFLNYLLSKVYHIKLQIFMEMDFESDYDTVLEKLMIITFFFQLEQASRKGLYRTYRTYRENDSHIRGTIDIARHIKLNSLQNNGKIAYSHREYTIDNPVNQLIYAAFTYARKKYPKFVHSLQAHYPNSNDTLRKFSHTYESFSRQQLRGILNNSRKKISHSLYKNWESVRKTSRLLLRNLGVSLSDSGQSSMKGILLNMNFLWEEYMRDITVLHKKDKKILNGSYNVKMDMYHDEPSLVLDAKYKNAWQKIFEKAYTTGEISWSDGRDDLYQVLSYMLITQSDSGGILFPCPCNATSIETDFEKIFSDNEYKYCYGLPNRQNFYLIPVLIPLSDSETNNYEQFIQHMKSVEEKVVQVIKRIK